MMRSAVACAIGLVLGLAASASAQFITKSNWTYGSGAGGDAFNMAFHLGYVAGTLDMAVVVSDAYVTSGLNTLGKESQAILRCEDAHHYAWALGDYARFADIVVQEETDPLKSAASAIVSKLASCPLIK